ncbi:methylmalonyl Co-A mutase-associated GTPase MeaB [Chloroflexota bacterium]
MTNEKVTRLINGMLAGQTRALAQLISLAENDSPRLRGILKKLCPHPGKACRIGVTGPPGSGKSTLVGVLTSTIRSKGLSVGVIAVDPSSPISSGSLLGDRIRMSQHYLDEGVFIRSMATRGSYGGLSEAVASSVNLLDAFGKDIIIVETAGVGQIELSIREIADTLVLVLVPGYGDGIQAMKAGLIEVADIIVVNKADQPGAERLVNELQDTLAPHQLIMVTEAISGTGIEELYQAIDQHHQDSQTHREITE